MNAVTLTAIQWGLLFAVLIVAAYTDLLHRKVYNWLTLPACILGVGLHWTLAEVGGPGLTASLAGLGIGFGVFLVAYVLGGVGGGDVKLMGAIGAIGGAPFIVSAIFWSALVGAGIACWKLAWQGKLLAGVRSSVRYGVGIGTKSSSSEDEEIARTTVPYGVAIAFGTVWAWVLEIGHIDFGHFM